MQAEYHGGGCCGMRHIAGFTHSDMGDLHHQMMTIYNDSRLTFTNRAADTCLLVEAVVTDSQQAVHHADLKAYGFEEVNTFKNVNSNNVCRVYHYLMFDEPVRPSQAQIQEALEADRG